MNSVISTKPITRKSQPSRKGKKAWRKNVNITDIEKKLEGIRVEERVFGLVYIFVCLKEKADNITFNY